MGEIDKQRLVRTATGARKRAVAPYSNFEAGSALLAKNGEIITGANVESASYGLTCCAERVVLLNALTSGRKTQRGVDKKQGIPDAGTSALAFVIP